MFKQRKARGSLKQKKAESGSDNESESEGVNEGVRESGSGNKEVSKSKSKIKSKSVKKKPGPSMSFMGEDNDLMDEEGGGDVAVFKVKKSKLSKTIKRKLHQNHEVEEPLVSGGGGGGGEPVSAYGSSSSSVSPSDYLSSLRKEQNYSAPQMQSQTLGGLEGYVNMNLSLITKIILPLILTYDYVYQYGTYRRGSRVDGRTNGNPGAPTTSCK